jgi:hypothetical protein
MNTNEAKNELVEAVRQAVREELQNFSGIAAAKQKRPNEWATAAQLAEMYGLTKRWFEDRGREGKIKRSKPGKFVLFFRPDVDRFLADSKNGK